MSNRREGYYKEWYAKNREKGQEKSREFYHRTMADPEKRAKHVGRRHEYHNAYYAANKERYKARAAEWYQRNKERAQAQHRAYYQKNRERAQIVNHGNRLKRQYGITREQHAAMIEQQGNSCAICGGGPKNRKQKWLSVDHDHLTGKVRGLLCDGCNTALGNLSTVELLQAAQRYLEHCS